MSEPNRGPPKKKYVETLCDVMMVTVKVSHSLH